MYFIPEGMTDLYQPFDVKLFNILKAYLKHIVWQFIIKDRTLNKPLACKQMVKTWEKLPIYIFFPKII